METTFRIHYGGTDGELPAPLDSVSVFEKLSEMLCRECGGLCQGFFLTHDAAEYQAHPGPKIGWAFEGHSVFLRMANCKQLHRVDQISQFLKLFDMNVVESKLIQ